MKNMASNDIRIIDANVLLRYFLCDDEKLFEASRQQISSGSCVVIPPVLQEVLYVLCGPVYRIPRDEAVKAIRSSFDDLFYTEKDVVETALDLYLERPKLDFPDCLLVAYNRICQIPVLSHDRKLNQKLSEIQR